MTTTLTNHAKQRISERAPGFLNEIDELLKHKKFNILHKADDACWAVSVRLKNGQKMVPIIRMLDGAVQLTKTILNFQQYLRTYEPEKYKTINASGGFTIADIVGSDKTKQIKEKLKFVS
jgi:hypothetical protein